MCTVMNGKLEAAGEEAEHQQHVGAMRERFAQRLAQRLRRDFRCCLRRLGVASAIDSGSTASMLTAKIVSVCCQPNVSISATATGEYRNCPNEPAAVPKPKASRAPFRRQQLAERRQHHHERAAGQAEADQHAGRSIEHRRACRMRHQRKAGGVQQRAGAQHPHGAEAVGDDAARAAGRCPTANSATPAQRRIRRGPNDWRSTAA